jgi:uncharacterized protein (UPF0261 family)
LDGINGVPVASPVVTIAAFDEASMGKDQSKRQRFLLTGNIGNVVVPQFPDPMHAKIYAIATADTKGAELAYLAERCREEGARVVTVDAGFWSAPTVATDVPRETIVAYHAAGASPLLEKDRAAALSQMSEALTRYLLKEFEAGRLSGIVGLGGTGGTALLTHAMRALPLGLPKLMVSTVAGTDVSAYVQGSDIIMMPSIVDISGINRVSARVLANAAGAIAGMVRVEPVQTGLKPCVGLTMFGVTTPCVTEVRTILEKEGYDCLVFHATGTGGQAMERLVQARLIEGVIDVTTTEVADEVVGGVFPAGPQRFDAILRRKLPFVLSMGALDMVNFWAPGTVPAKFADRKFHRHNDNVTLMRTTPAENRAFARWIATKLNRAEAPFTLLLPEGGISALDAPGRPFHDPVADEALFGELEQAITPMTGRKLVR